MFLNCVNESYSTFSITLMSGKISIFNETKIFTFIDSITVVKGIWASISKAATVVVFNNRRDTVKK